MTRASISNVYMPVGFDWTQTIPTTLERNKGYLIDTTSSPQTVNLPVGIVGATISISDFLGNSSINNITVSPSSGERIEGSLSDLTVNIDGAGMTFVYTGSSVGWKIVNEIGTNTESLNSPIETVTSLTFTPTDVDYGKTIDMDNVSTQTIIISGGLLPNDGNFMSFFASQTEFSISGSGATLFDPHNLASYNVATITWQDGKSRWVVIGS